jgi:hypothetical protein
MRGQVNAKPASIVDLAHGFGSPREPLGTESRKS